MFSKRFVGLHQRVRYSYVALPKVCVNKSGLNAYQPSQYLLPPFCFVRNASTDTVVPPVISKVIEASSPSPDGTIKPSSYESLVEAIGPIPDSPPLPPPKVIELLSNGEPSITSLGLGGYYPSGLFQHMLEFIHLHTDLSWGWTIVLSATIIRALCFKLVVKQRLASIRVSASMPQQQFLQEKINEARQQNDLISAARYSMELEQFMKTHSSPFSMMKYAAVQGVILISMTHALRAMTSLPVEALQTGGLWFHTDLTATDPTYVLPLINGFLFYLHLATGKEIKDMFPTRNPMHVQAGMVGVSALLALFSANFSGAIVLYWITSSSVTVVQYHILSHPKVKEYYGLIKQPNSKLQQMMQEEMAKKNQAKGSKGFMARIREAQANNRLMDEVKRRSFLDSAAFERAGREPIRKTYKYDITKLKKP